MHDRAFKFKKFEIKSNVDDTTVDLRSGTPRFEYRESIFMPYVELTAYIIDSGNTVPADDGTDAGVGLLDGGLGQGTETIKFKIEDEMGNKIDFGGDNDLRVASVRSDFQGFKNESYAMKIVSKEAFDNTLLKNRCTTENYKQIKFSGKISDVAKSIVDVVLESPKAQKMNSDETLNEFHSWGQNVTPFEMLLELQQLAIPNTQTSKGKTAKGNTAGYLFFQTSNGYQFRSLDGLMFSKKVSGGHIDMNGNIIRRYLENNRGDENLPASFDGKILWSNMSRSVDALHQFETGGYAGEIMAFNEITKELPTKTLQSEGTGNGIIAGRKLPTLNKDYLDSNGQALPTVQRIVRQAVGQNHIGNDSLETQIEKTDVINYNNEDIILQAQQNYHQKMEMSAEIIIDADLSLNAGDLIFCEFPELSTKVTTIGSKTRKSGIYMIADLCHYGDKANSFTGLHLVRGSFGVKT